MTHKAKERLQQQQLRGRAKLLSALQRVVLTCRCDPSRLFWVIIQRRCIEHKVRSEEEDCSDLEKSYKDNARCSSMKYQDTLWNTCRTSQSSSSGESISGI